MPSSKKHDKIASYVIGAPWPKQPNEICVYMVHGTDVFSGTLRQAESTLSYVKAMVEHESKTRERYDWQPRAEDYQIYQLVPIKLAE